MNAGFLISCQQYLILWSDCPIFKQNRAKRYSPFHTLLSRCKLTSFSLLPSAWVSSINSCHGAARAFTVTRRKGAGRRHKVHQMKRGGGGRKHPPVARRAQMKWIASNVTPSRRKVSASKELRLHDRTADPIERQLLYFINENTSRLVSLKTTNIALHLKEA